MCSSDLRVPSFARPESNRLSDSAVRRDCPRRRSSACASETGIGTLGESCLGLYRMRFEFSEPAREREMLFRVDWLVAKEQDLVRHQLIAEPPDDAVGQRFTEIDSGNLGADCRRQFLCFGHVATQPCPVSPRNMTHTGASPGSPGTTRKLDLGDGLARREGLLFE